MLSHVSKILSRISLLAFLLVTFPGATLLAEEPIKVGLLTPMSGSFALMGAENKAGFELALKERGVSDKFEIVLGDTQAKIPIALSEFRRMLALDIKAAFLLRSPLALALNPVSQESKTVLLGGVAHPQFVVTNQYAFRAWASTVLEGGRLAEKALSLPGKKSVAIISSQDDYNLSLADEFKKVFTAGGGRVVFEDIVSDGNEVRPILTRLKNTKPDLVFINVVVADMPMAVKQADQLGIHQTILSSPFAAHPDVQALGKAAKGIYYPSFAIGFDHLGKELEPLGFKPTPFVITGYTSGLMVAEGFKRSGFSSDRDKIYQAFLQIKELNCIDKTLEVKDREIIYPVAILQTE